MPIHSRVSGVWQEIQKVYVRVSGVWQEMDAVHARVSGVWQKVHQKIAVTLSGNTASDFALDPANATAGFRFNSDGTVDRRIKNTYAQIDASTDWIIPNGEASSDYEIRCTSRTGSAWSNAAAADDSWVNLGSNREWSNVQSGVGTRSTTCTFEIRKSGGSVLDSGSYTAIATVET